MFRMQFVLVLVTLYVGLAHSWDIAVSVGDLLEFYDTNGTKTKTVKLESRNITAIVHDEANGAIWFVDKQKDYDAICAYELFAPEVSGFCDERYGSDIHDLAIDPARNLLFFTDTKERSINWISLKNTEVNRPYVNKVGNLLIKMEDRTPTDISVDSCRGYIYWTNSKHDGKDTFRKDYMERARLDGSERQVIYYTKLNRPVHSFAIDPQTHTNYYTVGTYYEYFYKVDLNVKNINIGRKQIYFTRNPVYAQDLTVTKDYIYWVNSATHSVWQMLKNSSRYSPETSKEIIRFHTGRPFRIAAVYGMEEQLEGVQDCEAMSSLIPTIKTMEQTTELYWSTTEQTTYLDETSTTKQTAASDWSTTEQTTYLDETSTTEQTEASDWSTTEQTTYLDETSTTEQTAASDWSTTEQTTYLDDTSTTEQTEASDWSTTEETTYLDETSTTEQTAASDWSTTEQTTYLDETSETEQTAERDMWTTEPEEISGSGQCIADNSGQRNRVHACHGYCLNNGDCSLNEKREPVCQCKGDYVGDRCEVSGCMNYCFQGSCSLNDEEHPKCRCNAGYSGARCEVYACHSYCLNNGDCSLNEEDEPVCQCVGNHDGSRCEAVKNHTVTYISQYYSGKQNFTLADLLSNRRKPTAKISVVVEV